MSNIFLVFVFLLKTVQENIALENVIALQLGEACHYDVNCQRKDSNSECAISSDQQYSLNPICTCKLGYRVEIFNNTKRCTIGKISEEKEGLTAAPIILCFMGCVVVEAFCLLAYRYWKKHRRFSRQTLHLEAFPMSSTNVPQNSQNRSLVSFMITTQMDSTVPATEAGSPPPPPYNQTTAAAETSTRTEDPPPSYEEAMKQCTGAQSVVFSVPSQRQLKRKMSC